jgi:hypothetical protein
MTTRTRAAVLARRRLRDCRPGTGFWVVPESDWGSGSYCFEAADIHDERQLSGNCGPSRRDDVIDRVHSHHGQAGQRQSRFLAVPQ